MKIQYANAKWCALSFKALFLIISLSLLPEPVAARAGIYVEASGGLTQMDNAKSKCNDFESTFHVFNADCSIDEKGTQFSAGGGLRLGEHFELGGRYEHIEKVILRATGTGGGGTATVKSTFGPITGIEILGRLHFGLFYFEGGVWRWSADSGSDEVLTLNNSVIDIRRNSQSDSAWSPLGGIGLYFNLADHFALRTGYSYKWVDAGNETNERFHVVSAQIVIFN